ncbi:unnamed protein product [Rotaria socialis]|uniref:Cornichon n=1 Tax=Rotaria socialis TaxID=392032 RepID=A0A819UUZ2_9BILA|nr:unnamed protein product [Rotaria socialis]CAF4101187.1 unnamed protein product [Rotaria socialis]CAF4351944.1 unnamed protein product [Rotaria socialis]
MSMAALLFGFAMVDNILLLFISVYNIITLSDLEIDIINVRQACSKLNQTFLPEVALHVILTVLFIINNNWFLFIFNILLDFWFVYKYFKRQPGQLGVYDPLELNNRRSIKANMRVNNLYLLNIDFICFSTIFIGFSYSFNILSHVLLSLSLFVNPRVDLNTIQLTNTKQITFCNACTISIQTKTILLMSIALCLLFK